MFCVVASKQFTRSLRKIRRSGLFKAAAEARFNEAVNLVAQGIPLPASYLDHELTAEWKGYRECHIKGDLLLIYQRRDEVFVLILMEIGSHSQLFG